MINDINLFFDCSGCNKSVSILELYRDRDSDNFCQKCYLEQGLNDAYYKIEEALYAVTIIKNSKYDIGYCEMIKATIEDLERIIKLKVFL